MHIRMYALVAALALLLAASVDLAFAQGGAGGQGGGGRGGAGGGAPAAGAGGQGGGAQAGGAGGGGGRGGGGGGRGGAATGGAAPIPFRVTSTAFVDSSGLNYKYTCSAGAAAVSPPLAWANPPMGTVSYTLILHDMDPRPMRGLNDILHWMVWNIPATTMMLPENVANTSATLADGSMQSNGNGQGPNFGFRPPCPPAGPPHHYAFELFALDTKTELPGTATRDDVTKAMDGHILGHSVVIGLYNR